MGNMITRSNAEALFSEEVASGIMQGAIKNSVVLQKFRRLPNMSSDKMRMRVLDALPMAYWVDEKTNNGRKKLTNQAWKDVYINVCELAVIVPIKESTLEDADFDVWGEVQPRIAEAFGKKIDEAALAGVDIPVGFGSDILTSVINAGSSVEKTASKTLYETINEAMVKVEESGYDVNGLIGGVGLKGAFRMMTDTTGQPLQSTEIGSIPRFFVDNGAWDNSKALMIVGDFNQAVYSIRQDISYKILTEASIYDPATNELLYALAQDDMVAIRAVMRLGIAVPSPANALQPDSTIRYPFAYIYETGKNVATQTVTFTVKDGEQAVVKDAEVTVGDITRKTNASGVATIKLQAGTYAALVKKGDKQTAVDVTVASAAVSKAVTLA